MCQYESEVYTFPGGKMRKFAIQGKTMTLFHREKMRVPLIVINTHGDEGETIRKALEDEDVSLLCVSGLEWNHDMAPWPSDSVYGDVPFTGGADDYIAFLDNVVRDVSEDILPSWIGIAGYSLAGLFALYSLYRTDTFSRAASVSGSLWFPGFPEFVKIHDFRKTPERIYLSLGEKEAKVRNSLMQSVQSNTEAIFDTYKSFSINTIVEMNKGGHFTDEIGRIARGIRWLLNG